jgi:hypothetical protein
MSREGSRRTASRPATTTVGVSVLLSPKSKHRTMARRIMTCSALQTEAIRWRHGFVCMCGGKRDEPDPRATTISETFFGKTGGALMRDVARSQFSKHWTFGRIIPTSSPSFKS